MKNKSEGTVKLITAVVTIVITLASLVWALATQNSKLEINCKEIIEIKTANGEQEKTINSHARQITSIETKLDYITKGIDEIKTEVKK